MKDISIFGFYGDLWFTFISITLLLLYWYCTKTFNYWRDKGVFYLEPIILFGNLKNRILLRQSFHEFQMEIYCKFVGHKYGGFFEGRRPTLMIRDPELIKQVMVRDFDHFVDRPTLNFRQKPYVQNMLISLKGSHWKAVRALLTPTFSSGKMRAMEVLVRECGTQMGEFLRVHASEDAVNGNELEMKEFFGRFTLEVIASCAFGVHCDSLKDPEAKFVKIAARFNVLPMMERMLIFFVILFMPKLARFFPVSVLNRESLSYLVALAKDTKAHRENNESARRNDFIQLMLDAAKKEQETDGEKVLDEDTIIAQALLFLLAGFETSSTLLTFAAYELALNPEIQTKLHQEISTVLSKHNNECNYEALHEMTYLEMVLLESLRKHPPVSKVDRMCTEDYLLPETTTSIEKGIVVSIPVIGLHYDPQYYPEPERFDPERFNPEEKSKRSPYVFLPFGAGPRNCIGTRFALMSTKIAIVYLLKDFKVKRCSKTEVPYVYRKTSMLLQAQNGIWLSIVKRE